MDALLQIVVAVVVGASIAVWILIATVIVCKLYAVARRWNELRLLKRRIRRLMK